VEVGLWLSSWKIYVRTTSRYRDNQYCPHNALAVGQSLGNEKPIDCIDDSIHITYLLCAADPYSPQCSFAAQNDNDPPFFSLFELIMLTISGFVFGMLASFVIVIFCRSRQAARELDEKPDGYMVVSMPSEADELLE
jgi:hypothetical protein